MYNYYEPSLLDRYANTLPAVYGTAPCVEIGDGRSARAGRRCSPRRRRHGRAAARPPGSRESVDCSRHRRPPVPVPGGRARSRRFYLDMLGLDPRRLAAAGPVGRPARCGRCAPYAGPVVHGRGVPAAGDQERGAVRAAVRHHLVRQRRRVRRVLLSVLAAVEVARRVRLPRPVLLYGALLRGAGASPGLVPQAALLACRRCRGSSPPCAIAFAPIFLANLVFAQRFKRGRVVDGGVRREPARRHGRRRARVPGADHRLPLPAGRGGVLYGLAFLTGRKHLSRRRRQPSRPSVVHCGESSVP